MRICHINLARSYSGMERQTELLVRALRDKPVQQRLLLRADSPLLTRLADIDDIDIRIVRSPSLLQSAVCRDCDILHAHEINAGVLAYLGRKRFGTPFALTSRHFSAPDSHPLARRMFNNVDLVFALSPGIEQTLRRHHPKLPVKVTPLMCAHLKITETFRRLKSRYQGKFVIGAACEHGGRIDRGIVTFIDAAQRLRHHDNLQFILIGTQKTLLKLGAKVKGLGIETVSPKRDLGDYLNCLDIFVSPFLHRAASPILVDAMEQGTAIIASDLENANQLIEHRRNGLLYPPGDAEALTRAVETLLHDPALSHRLMLESQHRAQHHFPEKRVDEYLASYQQLIQP